MKSRAPITFGSCENIRERKAEMVFEINGDRNLAFAPAADRHLALEELGYYFQGDAHPAIEDCPDSLRRRIFNVHSFETRSSNRRTIPDEALSAQGSSARRDRPAIDASMVYTPINFTTMNIIIRLFAMLLVSVSPAQCAEPAAKQFLRYIYGADGVELTNVCHPSDDAWMLRGAKNTNALAELDSLKVVSKPSGITSGLVGTDLYFIETRGGKVDPAFNLAGIYVMHRQLVLHFLYGALSQNREILGRVTTDASKVKIEGPKAAPGDMDQYGSILEMLPVVRASKPADDAKSRTVTYRVPIGEEVLTLTLLKDGSTWKIDTSKAVRVPLGFFFRER